MNIHSYIDELCLCSKKRSLAKICIIKAVISISHHIVRKGQITGERTYAYRKILLYAMCTRMYDVKHLSIDANDKKCKTQYIYR